jgi:serine/threonine-protein kinase
MDEPLARDLGGRLGATLGGQFEIGELIGAGGFAAVFRARDPLLGRDVAIKVLDPSVPRDPAAADQLLDEARMVATIEHPHIVPLYEAGNRDGLVFLVMRYFPDGTVGSRLERSGALPPAAVAQLGVEVADALAAAHARGVIHLDIKPDNILLDSAGHAAVSDFGIARLTAGAEPLATGLVSGTPHYMSPEQVAGDQLDGRADVYALGVVLYELATGRRPVGGDTDAKVMANQIRQTPTALGEVAPEFPALLAQVITRALAKDPAERWASAGEMAAALRAASAPDKLLSPRWARRKARRRWYGRMALVGGGLTAGIALLVYAVVRLIGMFTEGAPPALDAMAPMIPAPMLDSARAGGFLAADDTLLYLFAPHERGLGDALFVTTRDLIAVTGGVPRRYPRAADYRIDLRRTDQQGVLTFTHPETKATDTVYHAMTGVEQQVLLLALRRVLH